MLSFLQHHIHSNRTSNNNKWSLIMPKSVNICTALGLVREIHIAINKWDEWWWFMRLWFVICFNFFSYIPEQFEHLSDDTSDNAAKCTSHHEWNMNQKMVPRNCRKECVNFKQHSLSGSDEKHFSCTLMITLMNRTIKKIGKWRETDRKRKEDERERRAQTYAVRDWSQPRWVNEWVFVWSKCNF